MKCDYKWSPNHISEQEIETFHLQHIRKKHAGFSEMLSFGQDPLPHSIPTLG